MFNKDFINKIDFILILSVILTILCGIITLYTQEANSEISIGKWKKQILFLIIGMISMFFFASLNYQVMGTYALLFYFFSLFLLTITLIPEIGYLPEGRGARSWIKIPGLFNFQTSEIAKFCIIITLSQYLVLKEKESKNLSVLMISFVIIILPMFLIILQPDFGTSISLLAILFTMLFVGGADILHISSLLILGSTSLFLPMYVAYNKIKLKEKIIENLEKISEDNILITKVKLLNEKIWNLNEVTNLNLEEKKILSNIISQTIGIDSSIFFRLFSNELSIIIMIVIFIVSSLIMLFIKFSRGNASLRKYYIIFGIIGISLLSAYTIMKMIPFSDNQVIRVTSFLNPDKFRKSAGYQIRASKPAVGSGQLIGKGLTKGEMTEGKIPKVPESSTDFIFASWAEQTGFLGSIAILILLFTIIIRSLQISYESKDKFGALVATGITGLFYFHISLNIGIVIGLLPVTGLPLTFMSYGGSHLILSMTLVGILLSIKARRFAN